MNKSRDELPTTGQSLPPRQLPDRDRGSQFKMTQFFPVYQTHVPWLLAPWPEAKC